MKTYTLSTEQTNTQLNSSNTDSLAWNVKPSPQGALASPHDTDIREAGWAKNKDNQNFVALMKEIFEDKYP